MMRCNKCGAEIPDNQRFCPVCGHKLQSGRGPGAGDDGTDAADGAEARGQLHFQGWTRHGRGSGPYIEACVYAVVLAGGVVWYSLTGVSWPLYILFFLVTLIAILRRL